MGCAMTRMRRRSLPLAAVVAAVLLGAQPALACGGLVGPGGTVRLARTTTLAGYAAAAGFGHTETLGVEAEDWRFYRLLP